MQGSFQSVAGPILQISVWKPDGEVKAVVQILHGMAEHIGCYDGMAKRLNKDGFLVVGHNHLGHGEGAEQLGVFGKGGFDSLVEDAHQVRQITQAEYPNIPYFLLGHSMGSFVARNYCLKHEQGLAGVLLSGSGYYDPSLVAFGLVLANLFCAFGAARKPAKFIEKINFADYNRDWSPPRTKRDWLTRSEQAVDRYNADPFCGFTFTSSAYRDMFRGLKKLTLKNIVAMDQNVPVLLYAGEKDPVSGRAVGVRKLAGELKAAGVKDVTVKLYENGRHEMHNETNHEEVFQDLIGWILSRL